VSHDTSRKIAPDEGGIIVLAGVEKQQPLEYVLSRSSICSVVFALVAPVPTAQEAPQPKAPAELTEQVETEAEPPGPPPPPEGILPVGEIARLSFPPSDRPRAFLHQDRLVIVTASGAIEGHDAVTGEFRWKLGLPGESLFGPVLYRSDPFEILLSSASGRLFVVDAATGEIRRETQLPVELALAPLVDLPHLYAGTPGGDVVALDAETGSERFRAQLGEPPLALASSGGKVLVSGSGRMLTALEAGSGAPSWRFRGRSRFHAPAVFSEDRLYIGNDAGEFYCLSLSDGDTRFQWATGASIPFPALVEDRLVYVTSFGNDLYVYHAGGGAERYRVKLPGRPATSPVRFGRRLVVVTYDGTVVEVDPEKGAIAKTYAAPGELGSAPAFLPALPQLAQLAELAQSADSADSAPPAQTAGMAPPDPAVAVESPEPEWYDTHRIALVLRTGEVLLLGHRPEVEPEKEPEPPPTPPGETGTTGEDSLSWN
jgi:outer membrane protein assembly factor BamB